MAYRDWTKAELAAEKTAVLTGIAASAVGS